MRVLIGILSSAGLVLSGFFMMACFAAAGMSDGPPEAGSAWLPLLLPFLYYGYCLASSIHPPKGALLLTSGLIAHAIALIFCFIAVKNGAAFLVAGPVILAPCWFAMYTDINTKRKKP